MKTVEILAKCLPKWDSCFVRIVQGDDGVFYGVYASDELSFAKLNYASLAGHKLADDARIGVTQAQWEEAKQELRAIAIDEAIIGGTEIYDDQLREKDGGAYDKYQAKLQTLLTLLSMGNMPRDKFSDLADGISQAFDKIKL
ncbi:hypothetical protein SMY41_002339 [Cronobacter sakazakii]|nr:hypothetical protein [Cronobacter sakazakii]KAB0871696.1 hypothetical protein FZI03_12000 [Cronobacter sakazakii]